MIVPKFKVGDRVRFSTRETTMLYRMGLAKSKRTRTIVKIVYDPKQKCNYYYLGSNNKSDEARKLSSIGFRSYQLERVKRGDLHKLGKPRQKRKYRKKVL